MKFEAVLLDVDGTLLDTKELIRQSYHFVMAERFSTKVLDAHIDRLWGKFLPACYRALGREAGLDLDEAECLACCTAHNEFRQRNSHLVRAFDGILDMLGQVRAAGVRIGVVSSRVTNGPRMLQDAGIYGLADFVLMGDEVRRPKPHPESLLRAMQVLGTSRAVMVGDTMADIQAAKRAGISSIGVTYGHAGRRIALSRPTWVVDLVQELAGRILD